MAHLATGGMLFLLPVSELLSRVVVQIAETVQAAQDVLIEKENFRQLSSYLQKLSPVLQELRNKAVDDVPSIRTAVECLANELRKAKDLAETYKTKSRFYLFINCRSVTKQMQQIIHEIGRAVDLIPLSHLELSLEVKQKTTVLVNEMQNVEFKTALVAEEVANKIEAGLRDFQESSNSSTELLVQIAKAVGVDLDPSSLKRELEQLKKEKEAAELEKNQAEALQLEQIAGLLSWADAAHSRREKERQYRDKRNFIGSHLFPPLHSFYCPITQEVMEDPVEVSSGHTFEREAIQKWIAEGRTVCPVSLVELQNLDLKPNMMLKRSISEWKNRNIQIQLTSMGSKLNTSDEPTVFATLEELCELCEAKSVHRHWIAAEGLVPVLVNLLKSGKNTIRKKTLATLTLLVKDNLDNKVRACEAGVVTFAVRSLAREVLESRQAVALLLELSKEQKLCKQLSKAQGCVLLLVTMTNSEIRQAAEDAKMVLENLAKCKDHNVILMAEANYFKPLVQRMIEGSDMTQILMANTVSRMQLTDHSRGTLVQLGVLGPLITMLSVGNLELKSASLGALQNLSKLPANAAPLIETGIIKLLLELLFTSKSVLMTIKEQAADIFADLANDIENSYDKFLGSVSEQNETIYQLFSLLHLSGPVIQSRLLQALIRISSSPHTHVLRVMMREAGAIELLISLFMISANNEVRHYALKLVYYITKDGGGEILAKEMGRKPLSSLMRILNESSKDDVKSTAMGMLQNIPMEAKSTTDMMLEMGLLPLIVEILRRATSSDYIKGELLENTMGVLLRFTSPSNTALQHKVAESGIIPMLLQLLSSGSPLTKCRAAMSLGQFSESTLNQTCHLKKMQRFCCVTPQVEDTCKVHGGVCSVEKSFCLLEAQAIPLLIKNLEENEPATVEAALGAIATLLYDEFWEKGADVIAEERGVVPIIRLLTTGTSKVQESALWILERFFRKSKFREKYGKTAQMPLILLTQDGTNKARHYAARILAHLNILQEQSSYF